MNCLWKDIPDSTDHRGWRRVECLRCGLKLHPTPHPHEKIHSDCKGTPWLWEFGHWVEIALQVVGVTKARWGWLMAKKSGCAACDQRQAALNTIGSRLAAVIQRLRDRFQLVVLTYAARMGRIRRMSQKQLLTPDGNISRSTERQPDAVAARDRDNLDADVVANDDAISNLS